MDSVADDIDYPLDPASVTVTRIVTLVAVAAIAVPLWIGVLIVALLAPIPLLVKLAIAALLAGLTAFWLYWAVRWPRIRFERIHYRTDERGFTIGRGVVWRSVTSIPV